MSAPMFTQISKRVLRPRLAVLGYIKIGERSRKSGNGHIPGKLDHFRITTRARGGPNDNFAVDEAVHARVGPKPMKLDVRLLWNEKHLNFQSRLAAYMGQTCICTGNGEEAVDIQYGKIPCPCPLLKQFKDEPYDLDAHPRPIGEATCKPNGVLSVILEKAESFCGYHVFRTTSWETIAAIDTALDFLAGMTGGVLRFLPLQLVLYPTTDAYLGADGKQHTSKSWKVTLVLPTSFDTAHQIATGARAKDAQFQLTSGAPPASTQEESPVDDVIRGYADMLGPDESAAAAAHVEQLQQIAREDEKAVAAEFYPESTGENVQDAEYELEDDDEASEEDVAEAEREAICRLALEAMDWSPMRINNQVALYAGRMSDLVASLEQKQPSFLQLARQEYARKNAPQEPSTSDIPPAAGTGTLDLFGGR